MTLEIVGDRILQMLFEIGPFLSSIMLQAGALIGIFSSLLLFQDSRELGTGKTHALGITLGITCFTLTGFMSEWLGTPVKTLLLTDFIFLAGFLGGLGNALWAASFALLGRILFVGAPNSIFMAFDVFTIALLSSWLRHYYIKTNKNYMSLRSGIVLILWRLAIVETPIVILYFLAPHLQEVTLTVMGRRIIGGFSFSVFIVFVVIMLLRREQARINQLYYDALTGLPNRRAFQKEIEEKYKVDIRKHRSLLFIDIKNFRDLLQEMGHDWVDAYCLRLSKELSTLAKKDWLSQYRPVVYSFSDHSFVLILHGIRMYQVEDQDIGHKVYNALLRNTYEQSSDIRPWLTISVFKILPKHIRNARHFLQTLTLAERPHEGVVQYFKPDIIERIKSEAYIRQLIEEWVGSRRVPLCLQPKVFLKDGRCVGAEALLRAKQYNSNGHYLSPPEVFSIAATHHMLEALEWATAETIVAYLEEMPEDLGAIPLSLNLSPVTFSQAGFGRRLCALLAEKKIEGRRLLIEIIETSEIKPNAAVVRENFDALTKNGVKLSLDDFGTGYASISLLARLDFSELKLDYSMISNMEDPRVWDAIILGAEGARRYNATVVAEGIETVEQQRQLFGIGVEKGQGFLFGKAMEFESFVHYARQHSLHVDEQTSQN